MPVENGSDPNPGHRFEGSHGQQSASAQQALPPIMCAHVPLDRTTCLVRAAPRPGPPPHVHPVRSGALPAVRWANDGAAGFISCEIGAEHEAASRTAAASRRISRARNQVERTAVVLGLGRGQKAMGQEVPTWDEVHLL